MRVSDLCGALAGVTGESVGRFTTLARRLQDEGFIPKGSGGSNAPAANCSHAVMLLLAQASGEPLHHVADAVNRLADYANKEGETELLALSFITDLLAALVHVDDIPSRTKLAFSSSITVVGGDRPAILVRIVTDEEPLEIAFTENGDEYRPHKGETLAPACTIPGNVLFRVARAIEPLLPASTKLTYRTFPIAGATVNGRPIAEWRAGVEHELERMESR